MAKFSVIIPAAGRSTRYGGARNKLLEVLDGRPVIHWAVAAFLRRRDVATVMVPTQEQRTIAKAIGIEDERLQYCHGGDCRAASVRQGLLHLDEDTEWVAVHDGARPMVSQALIDRTFRAAREHGAAVPALPVQLTIKQATGPLPAKVHRTIPRNTLWAMQTPQIMRREALLRAFNGCPLPLESVTDDAQLLELVGEEVWLVEGEERNLKITTALDLTTAASLSREGAEDGRPEGAR